MADDDQPNNFGVIPEPPSISKMMLAQVLANLGNSFRRPGQPEQPSINVMDAVKLQQQALAYKRQAALLNMFGLGTDGQPQASGAQQPMPESPAQGAPQGQPASLNQNNGPPARSGGSGDGGTGGQPMAPPGVPMGLGMGGPSPQALSAQQGQTPQALPPQQQPGMMDRVMNYLGMGGGAQPQAPMAQPAGGAGNIRAMIDSLDPKSKALVQAMAASGDFNGAYKMLGSMVMPKLGENMVWQNGRVALAPGASDAINAGSLSKAAGEKLLTQGPGGVYTNAPGTVNALAASAGAVKGAEANAELPAKLAQEQARARTEMAIGRQRAALEPQDIFDPSTGRMVAGLRGNIPGFPGGPNQGAPPIAKPSAEDTAASSAQGELYKKGIENGNNAQKVMVSLDTINKLGDTLAANGFKTGSMAPERIQAQKFFNTLTGSDFFNPDTVANAEAFQKESTRLGFELVRTLGSREAQSVVQQGMASVPNIEQSPLGRKLIVSSLKQGSQRDIDYASGMDAYRQQNGTLAGYDQQFNQTHPPASYVAKARLDAGLSPIDPAKAIQKAREKIQQGADKGAVIQLLRNNGIQPPDNF